MASKRAKLIAARDRERRKQEQEAERQSLAASLQELRTRTAGFSKSPITKEIRERIRQRLKKETMERLGPRYDTSSSFAPARPGQHVLPAKKTVKYSGELAMREERAKIEAQKLRGRVGQVGNKMGPQYLTDSDLQDMRKGLLRRRS